MTDSPAKRWIGPDGTGYKPQSTPGKSPPSLCGVSTGWAVLPSGLTALFACLQERKVNLVSIKDGLDLSTAAGRLMAHVLASVAQFETEDTGRTYLGGSRGSPCPWRQGGEAARPVGVFVCPSKRNGQSNNSATRARDISEISPRGRLVPAHDIQSLVCLHPPGVGVKASVFLSVACRAPRYRTSPNPPTQQQRRWTHYSLRGTAPAGLGSI